jgi:hypothetical protein
MTSNWFIFLSYFKLLPQGDAYIKVSCGAFDATQIRSDRDYFLVADKFNDDQKKIFGPGFTLICQPNEDVPTVIIGNPALEEDHYERERVFFESESKFYETLDDKNE